MIDGQSVRHVKHVVAPLIRNIARLTIERNQCFIGNWTLVSRHVHIGLTKRGRIPNMVAPMEYNHITGIIETNSTNTTQRPGFRWPRSFPFERCNNKNNKNTVNVTEICRIGWNVSPTEAVLILIHMDYTYRISICLTLLEHSLVAEPLHRDAEELDAVQSPGPHRSAIDRLIVRLLKSECEL